MNKNNPSYSPELNIMPPVEIRIEEKIDRVLEKIDELNKKIDDLENLIIASSDNLIKIPT